MSKRRCRVGVSLRAYVEFYKSSQVTSVLPEVTLALFLGQQPSHLSMELAVYPTEQIELLAGNRNVTHLKYARYACSRVLLW